MRTPHSDNTYPLQDAKNILTKLRRRSLFRQRVTPEGLQVFSSLIECVGKTVAESVEWDEGRCIYTEEEIKEIAEAVFDFACVASNERQQAGLRESQWPWRAIRVLVSFGQHAVPTLIRAVQGADEEAAQFAAATLECIGPPGHTALPTLLLMVDSTGSPATRAACIRAIGTIGDTSALPHLERLGREGNSEARWAIARLGPQGVPSLIQLDALEEIWCFIDFAGRLPYIDLPVTDAIPSDSILLRLFPLDRREWQHYHGLLIDGMVTTWKPPTLLIKSALSSKNAALASEVATKLAYAEMNNISLLRDAESELCGLLRAGTDEITAYHATLALTHLKGKSKETFDILAERIHKQWQEISGPQGSNPGRHHALQISLRALEPCVTDKRLIGELMEMTRLPMVVMDHFNWREESVLALGRLGTGNVEVIEHLLTVLRLLLSKPNSSRDLVSCLWRALGETGIGLQGCSADIEELAAHTNGHAKILAVWAMTRLGVRPLSDLLNWPIADAWEVKAFINALDALTIPEERTLAVERLRLLIETEELAKIISPAQQDSDGWVTQGPYKGHGDEPRKHVLAVLEHLDCPIDVLHRLGGDIWQRVKRNQSAVGIDVMRISESMLGQKSTESYFNEGALLLGMIKADVATAIHNLAACLGKQKFGSTYLSFNLTGIRIGHDPNVNAIWALGEIGAASSEALPFLRHLCKDPDWRVRLVAEKAVEKVSDRQIEAQ